MVSLVPDSTVAWPGCETDVQGLGFGCKLLADWVENIRGFSVIEKTEYAIVAECQSGRLVQGLRRWLFRRCRRRPLLRLALSAT
jgi:hypothetical protein